MKSHGYRRLTKEQRIRIKKMKKIKKKLMAMFEGYTGF